MIYTLTILLSITLGVYFNNLYLKRSKDNSEKSKKDKDKKAFDEVLENLYKDKCRFKIRINNQVTITTQLEELGEIDIYYFIKEPKIALFKGENCVYTTINIDKDVIDSIINFINQKYSSEILDVVSFLGITYSKPEIEKMLGVKWEDFQETMNKVISMTDPTISGDREVFGKQDNEEEDIYSLDDILDKIGRFGMKSLTNDEKRFLDEYSRG